MDRRRDIDDTAKWRQRYLILTVLRTGGFLFALLGLLLMRGGVLLDAPQPLLGAVLLIVGLLDALLIPRFLKRAFDRQDSRG